MIKRFLVAVQFLTALPVRLRSVETEELAGAMPLFPLVGLLIGAIMVGADWALRQCFGLQTAALMDVILLVLLTRAFHLDGLADTADAFWSMGDRGKMLAIMKDSRVGSMGAIAVVCVLLAKWQFLADLTGQARWVALAGAPMLARCSQVLQAGALPYARPEGGLGAVFIGHRRRAAAVFAIALPVLLGAWAWGRAGALAAAATLVVVLLGIGFIGRRLGGATGDTIGALSEVAEAAAFGIVLAVQNAGVAQTL